MEKEYETLDEEGRELFYKATSGHIKNYLFTDPKNQVDMYLTGYSETMAVVEIKLRKDYTSKRVKKIGGQVLERDKYYALIEQIKNGYIPLYAVMYEDGILAIWNISYIKESDFVFHPNKYPKSTVDGKGEKKPKLTVDLQFDDACTIMRYK